jgi:hypothetical protein
MKKPEKNSLNLHIIKTKHKILYQIQKQMHIKFRKSSRIRKMNMFIYQYQKKIVN